MRIRFFLTVVVAAAAVAGCATSPPTLEFSKPGVAPAQVDADHEACWQYALNTPEGQSAAKSVNDARAVGSVLGGPLAMAVVAAEQSAHAENRKKDLGYWSVRNDCMREKGYSQRIAGW
jgi:hypothetical protein